MELRRVAPRQRRGEDGEQLWEEGAAPGWPLLVKKTEPAAASGRMSPERLLGSCILDSLLTGEAG